MQKTILRNIIIATLPIFAYIIADSLVNNTFISLAIAIGISVIEFIYSFIKYKKIDFFIFFDLGLILFMGILSIILNNPFFFKLKPAIIEFCLVIFLIPLSISSNFIEGYLSRYFKDIKFDADKLKMMKRNILMLIPIIILHIILIVISALFLSKEVWGFISGVLLYIIFGVVAAGLILFRLLYKKFMLFKYKNSEWFDIVDENSKIIGKMPRELCHNGSKLLHPVVHIHLINSQRKLLLQKRSLTKDIQPGKWDTSVGGHIISGEELVAAIKREVQEEAGIAVDEKKLIPLSKYVFESNIERELVFSFAYIVTGEKIVHQESEIDEVKFFNRKEIENLINNNLTTPNFIKEYEILNKTQLNLIN